MTQEANYEHACELIDMDSFIDYYATQIYIARIRRRMYLVPDYTPPMPYTPEVKAEEEAVEITEEELMLDTSDITEETEE